MAIAAILASSFFAGRASSAVQSNFQKVQQDFHLLGEDLQSGNLAQAQSDFSALERVFPGAQPATATGTQVPSLTTNPLSQEISQLGQDLKTGNLPAAQSDFSTLQRDLQQLGGVSTRRYHHHHRVLADATGQQNPATLFGELGQDLQSGNLAAAQQTYSALQQDFLQFASTGTGAAASGAPSGSTSSSLSVTA